MYPEEEFLKADGFDDAIIGVEPSSMRLVYNMDAMLNILISDEEMTEEDALEHLDYNVYGAYVGEKTPIYINI